MVRLRDSSGSVRPAAGLILAVSQRTWWIAGMGSALRMASFTGTSRSVRRHGWILPSAVGGKRGRREPEGLETGVMKAEGARRPSGWESGGEGKSGGVGGGRRNRKKKHSSRGASHHITNS